MQFTQVEIKADQNFTEILIAELSDLNYESFWEDEEYFVAYIEKDNFDESVLKILQEKYWEAHITYAFSGLESKNWNQEWEKNFQPITVAGKCHIRATFHESLPNIPLEIIIDPKMSFGTGHHATTSMMIEHLMDMDLKGKNVMDVGCGSGILSIAAAKLGAADIFAFDIDEWSVENAQENISLNHILPFKVAKGTIADFKNRNTHFDLIMANITRNVLLEEISAYVAHLQTGGSLAISGFYETDITQLETAASAAGLSKTRQLIKEGGWASLVFEKS